MHTRSFLLVPLITVILTGAAAAKVDLVTLPERDRVQLTIYNSADLTLVREERTLTLKKGINRLEFGWEGTLIDPTSVQLRAPKHSDHVRLLEVAFPPKIKGAAVWTVESDVNGPVPVEISFFTSGISWRAFYMGTLSGDEQTMRLQGYVRVENRSGEDYENAETRVIVGKIHLLDEIAELARRETPYGTPGYPEPRGQGLLITASDELKQKAYSQMAAAEEAADYAAATKSIVKEGMSEYFLYSIEGTESIPNGWGKRLPSFEVAAVPVENLFRFEEERYGSLAHRLIYFQNDEEHELGKEPLPDGKMKIFRDLGQDSHLSYVGEVYNKYIPMQQDLELDLGNATDVKVEPILMAEHTENYTFSNKGDITGFDRIQLWEIELQNNRNIPIRTEVWRNLSHAHWKIDNNASNKGTYEKVDVDSAKYVLDVEPNSAVRLKYTLTLYEGDCQYQR
ncbi:MAG: hypothetical protein L0Y67_07395 [Gammaproteobacteria bacterium]|nr:hypothetical protein [Gammaproteobacteria bacterium]MCI0591408.1 hypothetical protein [Gammaproteobacteria bacterium]